MPHLSELAMEPGDESRRGRAALARSPAHQPMRAPIDGVHVVSFDLRRRADAPLRADQSPVALRIAAK